MLKDERVDVSAARDLLGQDAAIRTLVAAIEALPPPACVALYGPWGSGKTNILHNARKKACHDLHVPVWFDPWHYDQQPDLLGPLIRALLETARAHRGDPERWAHYKGEARRFYKAARTVLGRVVARKVINYVADPIALEAFTDDGGSEVEGEAPGSVEDEAGAGPASSADHTVKVQDLGALERLLDDEKDPHDAVTAVKRRFAKLVEATLALAAKGGEPKENRRVVFFLDDLDRCLPDRVVELIEGVKLLLCGSEDCRAIFVFALDRRIVGEAIRNRFPGASQYTGENYLEKIFDFSMETPPLPSVQAEVQAFVEYCAGGTRGLAALCAPFGNTQPVLDALSVAPLANPRVIKRTLNRLGLLSSTMPRETLDELTALRDHTVYKRLLVWLGGTERFRTFRYFVRDSDWDEVWLTIKVLGGQAGSEKLSAEAMRLTHSPGLWQYVQALGVNLSLVEEGVLHAFKPGNKLSKTAGSLKWFDDLMRSAGL